MRRTVVRRSPRRWRLPCTSEADDAPPSALDRLSPREREVLDLIGEGLTNRQIADRLFLAEKTIKNRVSAILAKLGVGRRVQAAMVAERLKEPRA